MTGVPPTTSRRRPSGVGAHHDPAVGQAGRRARRPLHPRRRRGRSRAPRWRPSVGSAPRTSMRRWSRGCSASSGPWSSHAASARYGRSSRSQRTSVRVPSSAQDPRRHVGVRGAGGRVGDLGGRPVGVGRDRRSTIAAPACRRPGWRGARRRPAPTSSRGSGPSPRRPRTRPRPSAPRGRPRRPARAPTTGRRARATQSWRPSTHATRVPGGVRARDRSPRRAPARARRCPPTRSATTSCPASAAAATTRWSASVA